MVMLPGERLKGHSGKYIYIYILYDYTCIGFRRFVSRTKENQMERT